LSLSQPAVGIYQGVVMGRDTVGDQMLTHAGRLGLRIKILPAWTDIDTHADLVSLEADPNVILGEHTREFLRLRRHSHSAISPDG